MKQFYLIGGTMGVGKTAICNLIKARMDKSVFLDGDWCWNMNPFVVTDETKKMVIDNICYLLDNFIKCSAYDNIVFCWVLHEQSIIDEILSKLDLSGCRVHKISLVCSPDSLEKRLKKDVAAGIRKEDVIERSLKRIPLYKKLDTNKLDVSEITIEEAADKIIKDY